MKNFWIGNTIKTILSSFGKARIGLLFLSLATFGVESAWGATWYGHVDAYSSPSTKGYIWVTLKGSPFDGNFSNDVHDESSHDKYNWSSSADFTAQFYAKPKDGYGFKGWFDNASGTGTNYSSSTSNNCSYSCTLTSKSKDKSNPANLVRYAVFAPSSASVTTNAGVTAQDPATSVPGSVVFTVSNADALADFKKPESITTKSGIGSFSVGNWSYADGKITINYTYNPNNTAKETQGELKLVSAGGENTCTATITGKANKKKTTIVWDIPTFILNKDEEVSDPAHAENGAEVKYKIKSGQPTDVIAISGSTLTGLKEGTCVIIAYLEGDEDVWAYQENEQTFTVTNKQKQTIDWNQKLSFNWTSGTLTETLDASANTPITYSIPSSASGWVTVSGTTLSIKGTGETTITATAAETDEYIGVSVTRTLIARDPTATCDDYIYDDGNSHEFSASGGNHTTGTFSKHPRSIKFQACKSMASAVGYLQIEEYYSGGWHKVSTIDAGDLAKDNLKDFGPYDLNYNTTQVKFTCNSATGIVSYKRTIANVKVLQAKSISADVSEIKLEGQIGTQKSYSFHITYDNVQGPLYVTSNETSIICPGELAADCGDAATNREVKITLNPTTSFSGKTLTISDQKDGGRTLTIPISATVSKNSQSIIWNDGTSYNSTDLYTLTATATSGLPVSYAIVSGPAQIVNNNQIQFTGIGSIQVKASQGGNEYYSPALDVTKTFSVSQVTPTISINPTATATITYGQKLNTVSLNGGSAKVNPFRGQATDHAVAGTFAWTNPNQVITDAAGTHEYAVTFTPTGAEAGMYNNASCKVTVTVNKITPTLTAKNEEDLEVYVNDTQTPKLNLVDYITEYSAADDTHGHVQAKSAITFACNQDGAVIGGNKFYATKAGTYTITATAPATDYYNGQTTTFTIKAINYYYSQAKSIVATNATTGKDGGWASVWQGNQDSASIGDDSWRHEDQTSSPKRLTETTHPYYFRAKVGTGYTFAGWFTSEEATEPESTKTTYDGSFEISTRDKENRTWITRYAKFTPITYTVTFVGNGNTGGSMSDQTFTYDVAKNLTANGFTRTGWSFTGWKDGNGTTYTDAQSVSNLASTQGAVITMTAQWNQDIYTVTLDPATYGTGGTAQISVKYNELIPTSITPPTPIDPAYIFLGYYDGDTQYYNADGTAVSGKKWPFTEGKTLTAKWKTGDYIVKWNLKEEYEALSVIPFPLAETFSGTTKLTYSVVEGDNTVISIEPSYIRTNKRGRVTLRACPVASEAYPDVMPADTILNIVGKQRDITWPQTFSFVASETGTIDQYVKLNAVASPLLGDDTYDKITYTVDNPSIATIEPRPDGMYLHVIGIGSTKITATVPKTEVYDAGENSKTINVYKAGDPCKTKVLESDDEFKVFDLNESKTFSGSDFSGAPCDELHFWARKRIDLAYGKMVVNGTGPNGETFGSGDIKQDDMSTSSKEYVYKLPEGINKIVFSSTAAVANIIEAVYITQKKYLEPVISEIVTKTTSGAYQINSMVEYTEYFKVRFKVKYSDQRSVIASLKTQQDWDLKVVGHVKNGSITGNYTNDCGDWGEYEYELSYAKTYMVGTSATNTITFYTSDGTEVKMDVTIRFVEGELYQFYGPLNPTGTDADHNWNDLNNWYLYREDMENPEHPKVLPTAKNPVNIIKDVYISSPVEVYSISGYAKWDFTATIKPTGGLTVYDNMKDLTPNTKFVIENDLNHQGYYRQARTKDWPTNFEVRYMAKSTLDNGANNDAVWQYFGIPVESAEFMVDYITWLYEWNEKENWKDLKSMAQPITLKAFTGYTITQYGHGPYIFEGELLHPNSQTITLTKTTTGLDGENMFANSFMSPMDVRGFIESDFSEGVEKTFYIYNSGSWNQWNTETQGGSHMISGTTPGSFVAIPILSSSELGAEAVTYIAPMQGVCVKTNVNNATIQLSYDRLIWNTPDNGQMNAPMRAPQMGQEEFFDEVDRVKYRRDSIAESYRQRELALHHRVRLNITSANSGADFLYLLERDGYTAEYDDGYDAKKMFTDGLVNIYTNNEAGQMAVTATNNVDSLFVGFNAGEDVNYKLFITSVIGDDLELMDMQTGDRFALRDSASYEFAATPNSEDPYRFRIFKSEKTPVVPTGWTGLGDKAKIWYNKQIIYISDANANSTAAIYTAAGELLKQVTFNHNTTISTQDIPEGVYTVRVEDSVLKFFVKH